MPEVVEGVVDAAVVEAVVETFDELEVLFDEVLEEVLEEVGSADQRPQMFQSCSVVGAYVTLPSQGL